MTDTGGVRRRNVGQSNLCRHRSETKQSPLGLPFLIDEKKVCFLQFRRRGLFPFWLLLEKVVFCVTKIGTITYTQNDIKIMPFRRMIYFGNLYFRMKKYVVFT